MKEYSKPEITDDHSEKIVTTLFASAIAALAGYYVARAVQKAAEIHSFAPKFNELESVLAYE